MLSTIDQNVVLNLIFGCLLGSMIFYLVNLTFPGFTIAGKIGRIAAIFANIGLFLILADRWYTQCYFPLSNLYESLLFLSWTLLFISFIVEKQIRTKMITTIILPLVLLIYGFASFTLPLEMQKASPLVPALQSNWLMMHVSLMMLSYSTLIIGSLLSILFLIILPKDIKVPLNEQKVLTLNNHNLALSDNLIFLKSANASSLFLSKLLVLIDNISYRIIGLGFPLLTLGIIAGAVWANEAWGSYWSWDPKETWALITWLVFAAYLHARIIKGWEGKRPAILASFGFIVVWICYLGVNFLGQGFHNYGWLS
jgi:cytochrome c-type biogenesis protein CcsB